MDNPDGFMSFGGHAAALDDDDGFGVVMPAPPPPQPHDNQDLAAALDAELFGDWGAAPAAEEPSRAVDTGSFGPHMQALAATPHGNAQAQPAAPQKRQYKPRAKRLKTGDAAAAAGAPAAAPAAEPAVPPPPAAQEYNLLDDLPDDYTEYVEEPAAEEAGQPEEEEAPGPRQAEAALFAMRFNAMTEEQRNRYEAYRRSNINKKGLKKLVLMLAGQTPRPEVLIALSSITKLFVGEVVEKARAAASAQGHVGALLPCHVRQAYQTLNSEGRVPHRGPTKPLFR